MLWLIYSHFYEKPVTTNLPSKSSIMKNIFRI